MCPRSWRGWERIPLSSDRRVVAVVVVVADIVAEAAATGAAWRRGFGGFGAWSIPETLAAGAGSCSRGRSGTGWTGRAWTASRRFVLGFGGLGKGLKGLWKQEE